VNYYYPDSQLPGLFGCFGDSIRQKVSEFYTGDGSDVSTASGYFAVLGDPDKHSLQRAGDGVIGQGYGSITRYYRSAC